MRRETPGGFNGGRPTGGSVKTAYHSLSHLQAGLTRGDGPQFPAREGARAPPKPSLLRVSRRDSGLMRVRQVEPLQALGGWRDAGGFSPEVHYVMTPDLALSAIGAVLLIAAFVSVPLDDVIEPILARFR